MKTTVVDRTLCDKCFVPFGTFLVNTLTVQSSCLTLRKKNPANPVTYQWQTVYRSAVLETEPSFMSGRILEVRHGYVPWRDYRRV